MLTQLITFFSILKFKLELLHCASLGLIKTLLVAHWGLISTSKTDLIGHQKRLLLCLNCAKRS